MARICVALLVAAFSSMAIGAPQAPLPAQSSSNSSTTDAGWLYHSMTKMAIETHNAIVSGSQIRPCSGSPGSSRSPPSSSNRREENVIFSPLSISAALSTLLLGSWGDTMSELRAGLGYPSAESLPEADIHSTYKANLDMLLRPGRGVEINYANTLFGGAGLNVILYFYQDIQNYYKSAIRGVDFEKKPVQAMKEINRWVSEQTKGRITDILTSPPSPETKLAVANAVYFKGAWEKQFSEKETKIDDFFVSEREVLKVHLMADVMEVPYVRDADLQAAMIALPYKTTQFALYVMLPEQSGVDGLVNLERKLTEPDIDALIRRMALSSTRVVMPRLKLSWRSDLREAMNRMGVCDVFSNGKADFRRLAVEDGIFLAALAHQAEIEINEKGTEASAATLGLASKTARNFVVNRPFLFFIRDNLTGLPLFWGRVVRPEQASTNNSTS